MEIKKFENMNAAKARFKKSLKSHYDLYNYSNKQRDILMIRPELFI